MTYQSIVNIISFVGRIVWMVAGALFIFTTGFIVGKNTVYNEIDKNK